MGSLEVNRIINTGQCTKITLFKHILKMNGSTHFNVTNATFEEYLNVFIKGYILFG
jgi:hypothetical protein